MFKIEYNGQEQTTNKHEITLKRKCIHRFVLQETGFISLSSKCITKNILSKFLGLNPGYKYTIAVTGMNKLGTSEKSEVTVLTANMSLPTSTLDYNSQTNEVTVLVNAVGEYPYDYCVTVQVSQSEIYSIVMNYNYMYLVYCAHSDYHMN